MNYLVIWAINIDAETPLEAAKAARKIQTNKGTQAKVFDVYNEHTLEPVETVDLCALLGKVKLELPAAIYTRPNDLNNQAFRANRAFKTPEKKDE